MRHPPLKTVTRGPRLFMQIRSDVGGSQTTSPLPTHIPLKAHLKPERQLQERRAAAEQSRAEQSKAEQNGATVRPSVRTLSGHTKTRSHRLTRPGEARLQGLTLQPGPNDAVSTTFMKLSRPFD
ncbi:hypothetical protein Q5P01_018387 [Channa striata]|uniref:Uncharacterized protein n=1 Tax=Channa striata TaxID=64152 RepID=A0AA88M546_CHASR|nr:hypothetical protein Q5P01_018387 [Channa striata]